MALKPMTKLGPSNPTTVRSRGGNSMFQIRVA
ncbi:hypothetical protein FOQG_18466 [Fusarium oxysporum f. sp. raphani 54005]|uniref:Uncharacterized protein n=2 Tax=Fusarium oxysporum TaxID=5507 RepID=X0C1Y5_FUSOX|nr:hypothetical protein FOWG_17123 [Fusarium oxysporum f. sp. lycopersici MN25]EXK76802.1 hypothetical protein FOQG_18466 [Fusarium oxysporum f. sp. raphani 54005]RYC78356.1 hypothetical protein BFJ63_vAg18770 [Fusarium oxysporum f. sp. narcissi]